jgi:hypothetical protein
MTRVLRARWLGVALAAIATLPAAAVADEPSAASSLGRPPLQGAGPGSSASRVTAPASPTGSAPLRGPAGENSTPGVSVATSSCTDLRAERIEELLRLEIATLVPVVAALPPLEVDLLCEGTHVRMTLRDPVTVKIVSRDVVIGATADPERALALAASELFLASWAELLILQRPHEGTRASDLAVVAAQAAVERAMPPRPRAPSPFLTIDLMAIGRERHLSAPLPTLGAAVRVGQATGGQHQLFAVAGWEWGSVQRPSGRVDIDAASAGAGIRWRLHLGKAELGLSGTLSVVYVSLQGVSSSPDYLGARRDGVTAEAAGTIDVSVTLRALRLGAAVQGGALAPGPVGVVDGAASVRLDGGWVGATCFAGLLL